MTEEEWHGCSNVWEMATFLGSKLTERKRRLFTVACCRRVWGEIPDERCRHALEITELHADGLASRKKLLKARLAAEAAARALATRWTSGRSAAWASVWAAAGGGAWRRAIESAISVPARQAAEKAWQQVEPVQGTDLAYLASHDAERDKSRDEYRQVADLLCHIVGNPFRPYPVTNNWPAAVVQLADALYNGQDCSFALHDALLEAGHPELADHFRQEQSHPKACWVVDVLLAKA